MSEQSNPTPEQIRTARHEGFNNSMAPMADAERRSRLTSSYQTQDARRENHRANFQANFLAGVEGQ